MEYDYDKASELARKFGKELAESYIANDYIKPFVFGDRAPFDAQWADEQFLMDDLYAYVAGELGVDKDEFREEDETWSVQEAEEAFFEKMYKAAEELGLTEDDYDESEEV